jgi:hypothetical protein
MDVLLEDIQDESGHDGGAHDHHVVVVVVIHIKPAFSCAKSITQFTILYI